MTNEEKLQVVDLRRQGFGYKRIAQTLNLSEGTVKTFCHRNAMACASPETIPAESATGTQSPCRCCGAMIPQYPGRKEKKFCSDACRNRWWNTHLGEVKRASMTEYVCPTCGKPFRAYDKRNRKYCSHSCYIADRFGGAR